MDCKHEVWYQLDGRGGDGGSKDLATTPAPRDVLIADAWHPDLDDAFFEKVLSSSELAQFRACARGVFEPLRERYHSSGAVTAVT